MPVTNVSDVTSLTTALQFAQAGDTIALAAGDYQAVTLSGLHVTGGVTITSQDPNAPAQLHNLNISSSSGLTFRNLTVVADGPSGAVPNLVMSSQDIHFDQIWFHGSLNNDPSDDAAGIQFRDSSDVSVTNSEFEQLYFGVGHLNDTRLTVSDNEFHDIRKDGVRGGGSSFVTVNRNNFHDFHIVDGDHGDAIQFWTTGVTTAPHDILIADNVFVRGTGHDVQGIFINDENSVHYDHVTIRGNLIIGATFNGIVATDVRDLTLQDNLVVATDGQRSNIRVESAEGGVLTNNSASAIHVNNSTGVTQTDGKILALATDGGVSALQQWQASHVLNSAGTSADDRLLGGQTGSYLRGAEGNDVLKGGGGFDDINGNQGDDTASGGSGDDWVVGGKDNDSLSGDAGNDLVYGNLGNDTCLGADGADTVRGGQDNDSLSGGAGNDYLSGDKGSDTMSGGAGADIFHTFGDAGLDRVLDFNAAEGDRVQLDPGTVYTVSQQGADTVIDMAGGGHMVLVGVQLSALPDGWLFGA